MSWARDEWKNNLPSIALQKVDALERSVEQLKRDQQQKKFQIESLEASCSSQKKKTEEQKSSVAALKKELHESECQCRDISINRDKVF